MKPRDDKKIELIYSATLQLVQEFGLAGITMSMIAKQAKLATGTVYLYFRNKEELIIRLFTICANKYAEAYFVDVDPNNGDFRENFKKVWMNIATHSIRYFDQIIFLEQCFHSPFIAEQIRGGAKEKFKPWYEFVDKGKALGLIKNTETLWLMIYVRGTIREMVKQCNYNHKHLTTAMMDQMFEMCWDGISV